MAHGKTRATHNINPNESTHQNMNTKSQHTREEWLKKAVEEITPIFKSKGYEVPEGIQVSCGFPSTGNRSRHIGECWGTKSSQGGINQIFISPVLHDPVDVLDTLTHELVHAVDDCESRHGKPFKKIANRVGLIGHMRSASAGPDLKQKLSDIAGRLGPYPHKALLTKHRVRVNKPRPKAQCEKCGFQVPMFTRFLQYGPPICPKDKTHMSPVGTWDEC